MKLFQETSRQNGQSCSHRSTSKAVNFLLVHHLKTVRRELKNAAENWEADIEHVHRLRVSARKALAVASIPGDLIPSNQLRWFRTRLKSILNLTGPARDHDVVLNTELAVPEKVRQCLRKTWRRQRRKHQRPINKLDRQLNHDRLFKRRIQALAEELKSLDTVPDQCVVALSRVRDQLLDAFPDNADRRSLHRLRIALRQFRYAVEAEGLAIEKDHKGGSSELVRLQAELGALQDHVITRSLLKRTIPLLKRRKCRKKILKLIAVEKSEIRLRVDAIGAWLHSRDSLNMVKRIGKIGGGSHSSSCK